MQTNLLGIMQGRLLPKYQGRFQAHPVNYWHREFPIASSLDLDCIQFILDFNLANLNPLLTNEGIEQINSLSKKYNVKVLSVCADYFMEAPLHSENKQVAVKSLEVLKKLLMSSKYTDIRDFVIPCVDSSRLQNDYQIDQFCELISEVLPLAEKLKVNLALETDLNPKDYVSLLSKLDSIRVTVNYDIGNSASLGYVIKEELEAYGERISDVHIKDRLLNGESVPLGTGVAKFDDFFSLIKKYNFEGSYIFQTYRDDEGLEVFKNQQKWATRRYFN